MRTYKEILERRARDHRENPPEHKALDHIQLANKRNLDAWRNKYGRSPRMS